MPVQNEPARTLRIDTSVNGEAMQAEVPARQNLVDFLRERLGLTGSHVGCEHGVCGACTMIVDGAIVRGCLMLAVQVDGCTVQTIEGADASGRLATLQACFHEHNALQCGFCTPGMLLTAAALLERDPAPTREITRKFISGNFCRCTGYQTIVDAVQDAARRMAGPVDNPATDKLLADSSAIDDPAAANP
jgi:carbon-monoxide dehydrogenase small subunit